MFAGNHHDGGTTKSRVASYYDLNTYTGIRPQIIIILKLYKQFKNMGVADFIYVVVVILIILIHIIRDAWLLSYIVVATLVYIVIKRQTKQNANKIKGEGRGVLITGCDSGKPCFISKYLSSRKRVRVTKTLYTPLVYSKTGVYRGIHYFLIFAPKHRLWILVRTASVRRF